MRILIFNWRDIKNPSSGGAEILTHELAKQWVVNGHSVIQLSSSFTNCKVQEIVDGVTIIRMGHPDGRKIFTSVHFLVYLQYQKEFKGNVDVVIDEIHGIPFFTPWYVKEKKVVLICEVANTLWYEVFGPFFGFIGWLAEKLYLRFIYKGVTFLTISESTKIDLVKNGVVPQDIAIIPVGIVTPKGVVKQKKEKNPTLIYVGRIVKSKGIEDAFGALKEVSVKIPNVVLWVLGRGSKEYMESIYHLSKALGVYENIRFFGFVSESEKFSLLSKAWILVHPSLAEGWGINVIEGNAVGTPTVGYNVGGLRDSIQHNKTGLLTTANTAHELAKSVLRLIADKHLYNTLSRNAVSWANKFSWEEAGIETLSRLRSL